MEREEWVNLAAFGNPASGQSPAASLCLFPPALPSDSWMIDQSWKITFLTLCITKLGLVAQGKEMLPLVSSPSEGGGGLRWVLGF